jgi:hypothetical protein
MPDTSWRRERRGRGPQAARKWSSPLAEEILAVVRMRAWRDVGRTLMKSS